MFKTNTFFIDPTVRLRDGRACAGAKNRSSGGTPRSHFIGNWTWRLQAIVGGDVVTGRRIRTHPLSEQSLRPSLVPTRGYWKQGEIDHPGHDWGADAT